MALFNKKYAANVTLTKATNGKTGVDKFEVKGYAPVIQEMRKTVKQVEELETKYNDSRALLVEFARKHKTDQELEGKLYKTFEFDGGENENPALVIFKNAFSSLDVGNEPVMRQHLGK